MAANSDAEHPPFKWKCQCDGAAVAKPSVTWKCGTCRAEGWSEDKHCVVCKEPLRIAGRRHHCRACGFMMCPKHHVVGKIVGCESILSPKPELIEAKLCLHCSGVAHVGADEIVSLSLRAPFISAMRFTLSRYRLVSTKSSSLLPVVIALHDLRDHKREIENNSVILYAPRFGANGLEIEFSSEADAQALLHKIKANIRGDTSDAMKVADKLARIDVPVATAWRADSLHRPAAVGTCDDGTYRRVFRKYGPLHSSDPRRADEGWLTTRAALLADVTKQLPLLAKVKLGCFEDGVSLGTETCWNGDVGRHVVPAADYVTSWNALSRQKAGPHLVALGAVLVAAVAQLHTMGFSRLGLSPQSLVVYAESGQPSLAVLSGVEFLAGVPPRDGTMVNGPAIYPMEASVLAHPEGGGDDPCADDWFAVGCLLWLFATGSLPQSGVHFSLATSAPPAGNTAARCIDEDDFSKSDELPDSPEPPVEFSHPLLDLGAEVWTALMHRNGKVLRRDMHTKCLKWKLFAAEGGADWARACKAEWPLGPTSTPVGWAPLSSFATLPRPVSQEGALADEELRYFLSVE